MKYIENNIILQLFSGGKDSFLSACKLLEKDNITYLVTYDNGCSLYSENVNHGVKRLIRRYGEEKIKFLGIYNISGIWRNFFLPLFNLRPTEIIERYGEITYSQFNCLTCRLSMYLYTIVICECFNISKVSDGARYVQEFAIETRPMLDRFKRLFKEYNIELIQPVLNLDSDWQIKNELLIRGFVPKVLEPQCLLGVPLDNGKLTEEIIEGVVTFYDKEIMNMCDDLINVIKPIIKANLQSIEWI